MTGLWGAASAGSIREPPVGLYVHVPFCLAPCSYCDFFHLASPSGVPDDFVAFLLREAELYREEPLIPVDTLYLGGGTPSLLSGDQLAGLLRGLREVFDVQPGAEVTLEANPETVDSGSCRAWIEAGIDRLSLGVQSFRPRDLEVLGRRASAEQAPASVLLARDAGFENLSLDLMAGLPGQGPHELAENLALAGEMPVTHLSLYLLDLHRGTGLFGRVIRGEVGLPGEDSVADCYEAAHRLLAARGFEHYEISNFARPGGRCRHNLKYWRGEDYIGLGPSAHGRFRGWMTANPRSLEGWSGALDAGAFPHERAERITEAERAENELIFGLRLSDGVDIEIFERLAELSPRYRPPDIDSLEANGYAIVEGGRLRLTVRGFLLSSEILGYLLSGFPAADSP